MRLVVLFDQSEGQRQIRERVGRQRGCEPSQVQLVDAARDADVLRHRAAARNHFKTGRMLAEHAVDEPGRGSKKYLRRSDTSSRSMVWTSFTSARNSA